MFKCDCCGCCCCNLNKSELYSDLDRGDGICKYLSGNLCSVYENRPLLCRIDEYYDAYFNDIINLYEYYRLNYEACDKFKNDREYRIMPLPVILAVGAVVAGAAGVGAAIDGASKVKDAKDTLELANLLHKENIARFGEQNKISSADMDTLAKLELEILESFDKFSEVFERIQGKPHFTAYSKGEITIPEYNAEELKKVSIGAGILLGGISGAAVGTAGGFAAAGATTAAVMALGTASTGTAIASLSGAAATNATLAALGGGAIAAGGGGIALGTTILGAATFGVGLLVGGVIFSITGYSLSDKADEAWRHMKKAEEEIDKICSYLVELSDAVTTYTKSVANVKEVYKDYLGKLSCIINISEKTDWNTFSEKEKLVTENTVLLVGLLFNMCKVQLVLASGNATEPNRVNTQAINKSMSDAEAFLRERA